MHLVKCFPNKCSLKTCQVFDECLFNWNEKGSKKYLSKKVIANINKNSLGKNSRKKMTKGLYFKPENSLQTKEMKPLL
jgi:hypothetical protein